MEAFLVRIMVKLTSGVEISDVFIVVVMWVVVIT